MQPPQSDPNGEHAGGLPGPAPQVNNPQPGQQPPTVVHVNNYIQPQPYGWVPVIGDSLNNSNIHVLHLVLTVLTCGGWAPVWIIHAIVMAVNKPKAAPYPVLPPSLAHPQVTGYPGGMPMNRNQEALAMIAQQKSRRNEARQLAVADPMTAKQLGIGRRDIHGRQYDDGGLIDINRVPAAVFTQFSGITSEKAAQIIAARDSLGGTFASVEELMATAALPPHLYDELTEYTIVIR
jgi:DNA uptake protein ComE-like DNA-binding protein